MGIERTGAEISLEAAKKATELARKAPGVLETIEKEGAAALEHGVNLLHQAGDQAKSALQTHDVVRAGGPGKGIPAILPEGDKLGTPPTDVVLDKQVVIAPGPLADRAQATAIELQQLQQKNGKERLTDNLKQLLIDAVNTPLNVGTWNAGAIGQDAALHTAQVLMQLHPDEYQQAMALLKAADGPPVAAAQLEKVMILKGLAAEYKPPAHPNSPLAATDLQRNAKVFDRLQKFAAGIHGMSIPDLFRNTRLIGAVDGTGLKQVFDDSCVPTSVELFKAESDPVYAFMRRNYPQTIAPEERLWLQTDGGGIAIPRQLVENFRDLYGAIEDHLKTLNAVTPPDTAQIAALTALKKYVLDPTFLPPADQLQQIEKTLAGLRTKPTDYPLKTVDAMRDQIKAHGLQTFAQGGDGTWPEDILGRVTNRPFVKLSVDDANGLVQPEYLAMAAQSLQEGKAVPFSIQYVDGGGHCMLLCDVKGNGPDQQFLVADPWTGKTQWVPFNDYQSGKFANDPAYVFQLGGAANVTDMYLIAP